MQHQSSYIILRKTPFQDNSLIVSGLSPDYGRIDFLLKGARLTGSKKFPSAELFRELSVSFKESKNYSGLSQISSFEPFYSHDTIALNTAGYLSACNYASFLLQHCKAMVEAPQTYAALHLMLCRMAESTGAEPWHALAKLVFLYENGFVPEENGQSKRLQQLLEYALNGDAARPAFPENYWKKLILWVDNLSIYHGLEK